MARLITFTCLGLAIFSFLGQMAVFIPFIRSILSILLFLIAAMFVASVIGGEFMDTYLANEYRWSFGFSLTLLVVSVIGAFLGWIVLL